MRSKEDAQDYRYFPEPDLLTIVVPEERIEELKKTIPELPNAKIHRYVKEFGLSQIDATTIAEAVDKSELFDKTVATGKCSPKITANWVLADVAKYTNDTGKSILETPMTSDRFAELLEAVEKGTISNSVGKSVFEAVIKEDKSPKQIIDEKGLSQNSDSDFINKIVAEVMANNEKSINDYKNGKTNALGYLVGQCMKASKGKANPGLVKQAVTDFLNNV